MNKTAILLGATGLTGRYLLEALIKDEDYSLIKVFSRRSTGVKSPKVEEHLIDLLELSKYESLFKADVIFCCIGTTKAKTPDSETYKKIDFGIPVTAARLAKKNNIPAFLVISALSANPNSRIFYNRVKGEMQHAILEQDIEETYIFQPSLIPYVSQKKLESLLIDLPELAVQKDIAALYDLLNKEKILRQKLIIKREEYLQTRLFLMMNDE